MRKLAFSLGILMSSASLFAAQGGTSTAQFLRIGQGARAEGMGGAFVAVADDAHAVHFNPAGLAQIDKRKLALDHLEFIEDIKSEYAAYVQPFNSVKGSLGADVTYVNMGTIDTLDGSGNTLGSADVNAQEASLAWGQAVGDQVAIGVTAKYVAQNLADNKDSTVAGDAGVLVFAVPDKLALGFAAQNLGSKMQVGTAKEDLPLTYRGGLAFYAIPRKLTFAADVEKERDTDVIVHAGIEYIYMGHFAVRGGYRDTLEAKGGFSAGASYIWHPGVEQGSEVFGNNKAAASPDEGMTISFDYAFVDYGDFDATHRFGISLSF